MYLFLQYYWFMPCYKHLSETERPSNTTCLSTIDKIDSVSIPWFGVRVYHFKLHTPSLTSGLINVKPLLRLAVTRAQAVYSQVAFFVADGNQSTSGRYRPGDHILLCGCVPTWQGGDHRQRPGQQDDAVLCGLHRHWASHRRCCQESGCDEPQQHNFRWESLSLATLTSNVSMTFNKPVQKYFIWLHGFFTVFIAEDISALAFCLGTLFYYSCLVDYILLYLHMAKTWNRYTTDKLANSQ